LARIIRIDPRKVSSKATILALETIRKGGVVAYPTETFYGLGVDALNEDSIKKIYAIKKRNFSQPLLTLIPHRDVLPEYVKDIPEVARRLMGQFWPGPLTLIFFASPHLPPLLCAQTKKIAVRISSHPIAQALAEGAYSPITSTSANVSGSASPTTLEEVSLQLGEKVDLIIDGGRTTGGKPSTIVDVTQCPPRLIREGIIPFDELKTHVITA
jgi:L-threonylcarbamoyladenylate synthase